MWATSLLPLVLAVPATAGTAAVERGAAGLYRVEREPWGAPRSLRPVGEVCASARDPVASAEEILRREPALFGVSPDELRLVRSLESLTGFHVTFTQLHQGLEVWPTSLVLHLDRRSCLHSADLHLARPGYPPAGGDVGPDAARAAAEGALQSEAARSSAAAGSGAPAAAGCATPELRLRLEPSVVRGFFHPGGGEPPRPAYRILAPAEVPAGHFELFVDAADGRILALRDRNLYAEGLVFLPSPRMALADPTLTCGGDQDSCIPPAAYSQVTLPGVTFSGGSWILAGPYAWVRDLEPPDIPPPAEPTPSFLYTRGPDGFEAVMAYYHIDTTQRYLQSLGFLALNRKPQKVDAHGSHFPSSHYDPELDYIGLNEGGASGYDAGEDGDIIVHEYGHAVQWSQVWDWGRSADGAAMAEGFADYLAVTMHESAGFDPPCMGFWSPVSECIRRTDSSKHYPEDYRGSAHADADLWSSPLWEARQRIGRDAFNRVLLESHYYLSPWSTFEDAVGALLDADWALDAGANGAAICEVMTARGFVDRGFCGRLHYLGQRLEDVPRGDGDGLPEPGERVVLAVTVLNSGIAPLTGIRGTLQSEIWEYPWATLSVPVAAFPDLAVGASGESLAPHFVFWLDEGVPCGTRLRFRLDLVANEGHTSVTFPVYVGAPGGYRPASARFASRAVPIPDGFGGARVSLPISDRGQVASVSIWVDISHTHIGDLVVVLSDPNGTPVNLHNLSGGAERDLLRGYPVPYTPDGPGSLDDFRGLAAAGFWTLTASDVLGRSEIDTGTINYLELEVQTRDFACSGAPPEVCRSSREVRGLSAHREGARLRLAWEPTDDLCHRRYRVYRSTAPGMRPAAGAGSWPSDPAFVDVTGIDEDGSNGNPGFLGFYGSEPEYYLVVDEGTDGEDGPVGHFGR